MSQISSKIFMNIMNDKLAGGLNPTRIARYLKSLSPSEYAGKLKEVIAKTGTISNPREAIARSLYHDAVRAQNSALTTKFMDRMAQAAEAGDLAGVANAREKGLAALERNYVQRLGVDPRYVKELGGYKNLVNEIDRAERYLKRPRDLKKMEVW